MKLINLGYLLFLNSVRSDENGESSDTQEPSNSTSNQESEVITSSSGYYQTGPTTRSSANVQAMLYMMCNRNPKCKGTMSKQDFLDLLMDYGCNCYPSRLALPSTVSAKQIWYHHAYNAAPIDDLDAECQKVAENYKCMYMDAENNDISQQGRLGCYLGMMFQFYFDADNNVICGNKRNPNYQDGSDDCRLASCQIERDFAYRAMALMDWDPASWKANNAHKKSLCPSKQGKEDVQKSPKDSCCGKFPNRHPFKSIFRECCDDQGTTASIGSCGV